ncbi:hypothetical protein CL658_03255 [bacterium]|nr:hypothetical protein [bacterium]|tara:strand:+ start:250 stop:1017 length:768 start_codon:yes stop_codon:yes gene_type:complete
MSQVINPQSLYFDKSPKTYNKNMHIQYEVFTKLLSLIDTECFETITDIGCGTGIITKKLHDHFNSKKTTGLDQSLSMIDHAKSSFQSDSLKFNQKSAHEFSNHDQADLIFSNATLQWIPDLNLFFKTLKQSITQPTTIAFSIFLPGTYKELAKGLRHIIDKSITIPAEKFESLETIKTTCKHYFKTASFKNHTITHSYKNIFELLNIIKQTGSKELYPPMQFTQTKLTELETWFLSTYNTIPASYEVSLGIIKLK